LLRCSCFMSQSIRIGSYDSDVRRLRENINDLAGEARKTRDKQIAAILDDKARDLTELSKQAAHRVAQVEQAQKIKEKEVDETRRHMDDKQKEIERKKKGN